MMNNFIQSQKPSERRDHERNPFTVTQLIAPIRDGMMPTSEDFFQVHCHDLAPNGFSFFLEEKPDFAELIVTFELPAGTVLVRAEVRNARKVLLYAESGRVEMLNEPSLCSDSPQDLNNPFPLEEGTPMTLVGCRFTGRRRSRSESL